jgi:hypothetical protein
MDMILWSLNRDFFISNLLFHIMRKFYLKPQLFFGGITLRQALHPGSFSEFVDTASADSIELKAALKLGSVLL